MRSKSRTKCVLREARSFFAGVFGAVEGKKNVRINGKTSLFSHFRFLCGNTHNSHLLPWTSSETVSFLRPLARREASTRRPFAVCMRWRKPCLLFLFLLWGWNVLFIVFMWFFWLFVLSASAVWRTKRVQSYIILFECARCNGRLISFSPLFLAFLLLMRCFGCDKNHFAAKRWACSAISAASSK